MIELLGVCLYLCLSGIVAIPAVFLIADPPLISRIRCRKPTFFWLLRKRLDSLSFFSKSLFLQDCAIPTRGRTTRRTDASPPRQVSFLAKLPPPLEKSKKILSVSSPNAAIYHPGSTSPCNSDDERKQNFIEKGTVSFSACALLTPANHKWLKTSDLSFPLLPPPKPYLQ